MSAEPIRAVARRVCTKQAPNTARIAPAMEYAHLFLRRSSRCSSSALQRISSRYIGGLISEAGCRERLECGGNIVRSSVRKSHPAHEPCVARHRGNTRAGKYAHNTACDKTTN